MPRGWATYWHTHLATHPKACRAALHCAVAKLVTDRRDPTFHPLGPMVPTPMPPKGGRGLTVGLGSGRASGVRLLSVRGGLVAVAAVEEEEEEEE